VPAAIGKSPWHAHPLHDGFRRDDDRRSPSAARTIAQAQSGQFST